MNELKSDPASVKRAREAFEAVAAGTAPVAGTGLPPWWETAKGGLSGSPGRPRTPRPGSASGGVAATEGNAATAMNIILSLIRNAGDSDEVLAEAGKWLTRFTHAVAEIVQENQD